MQLPKSIESALVSRIKILSNLKIDVEPGDPLRHDDALGEAAVGELDAGDDVPHGPQPLPS